jgi:type IV pilus assembly protein PilA
MDMIKKRAAMRGQSGFTLIELLVAVAILAVLAGVAVFAVGNLRGGAATNACKTEKDTLITAANAAIAKNGTDALYSNYLTGTLKYWSYTPGSAGTPAGSVAATPAAVAAFNPSPGDCSTAVN